MGIITLPTNYYQNFDADYSLDVPAEGYGGWKRENLKLNMDTTALVLMHAWDCGTKEEYPGWFRAVEYIDRAYEIERTVFPPLIKAVRESNMKIYHVVSTASKQHYMNYPGYIEAVSLAGGRTDDIDEFVKTDEVYDELNQFRAYHSQPGVHNIEDIKRGAVEKRDFLKEAMPMGNEGIADNAHQLYGLCNRDGVNHLIYTGFAINWCLLLSPAGMWEMQKRGLICSTIRQAVTAVENKETAREELCKELGLWRVAMSFGFVYDVDDFISGIRG